jgi:pyruvate carboxylase
LHPRDACCAELGIGTVAIYSQEDRFGLHRTKADEAYLVGEGKGAIEAYLDIPRISCALRASARRRHPSRLRFSVREPGICRALRAAGIIFVGPIGCRHARAGQQDRRAQSGRERPAFRSCPRRRRCRRHAEMCALAAQVGYPVMLKASWGGGGRGMRVIENEAQLAELLPVARARGRAAFGNDEVYLEKLVRRARHLEVQILGDAHGNLVHLYERDCTVQRRNQKVVERAPACFLSDAERAALCEAA